MSEQASVRIARALISVSDKTGVEDLARALAARGVEILSTGGTARLLAAAGIPVVEVAERTGFPEIMDGRVKTLHPRIHGGLLARRDRPEHLAAAAEHGIDTIDLLAVNLYPFRETVAAGAGFDDCIEQIDIGGPAMIRAAAKNHAGVAVLTDAGQYAELLAALDAHDGAVPAGLRRRLAQQAFAATAAYDADIAAWMAGTAPGWPQRLSVGGQLQQELRYGENPHQRGALYRDESGRTGVVTARQVQGKELSWNNLNDTDAAFELVAEFDAPTVAIIKHSNPCGVASADNLAVAHARALACDPVSAFGGIVACNRPLDGATAEAIAAVFSEVVIAPDADEAALAVFARKKNLRLLLTGGLPDPRQPRRVLRSVAGGMLLQDADTGHVTAADLQVVTQRAPTQAELSDLLFAFRVAKHVKSNAIVYAADSATVGVGAGQMSRVDSARIAAQKAVDAAAGGPPATQGSVVASDAFFPFADGLEAAIAAGATAVIQPGGSIRDADVIAAADARGIAMVFTGVRHFRH